MIKKITLSLLLLGLIGFSVFAYVSVLATSHPPTFCGDGEVQTPNEAVPPVNEKCDDSGESATCTVACGQKMLGWGWTNTFGWASLNSRNCDVAAGQYLYLDPTVPLGTCTPQYTDDLPDPIVIDYFVQVDVNNDVLGYAWSENVGWICFGASCTGTAPSGGWTAALVDDGEGGLKVDGWAKVVSMVDDGWFELSDPLNSPPFHKTIVELSDFNGFVSPAFKGFAWNNILGWLGFDPDLTTIVPWFQTKYGDIYARQGITGAPLPPDAFNATYRILADGVITNITSRQGANPFWYDPTYGPINFPTPQTRYSNILGRLDVDSLLCDFGGAGSCLNQNGKTVVDLNFTGQELQTPQHLLGGKIYYSAGDLAIINPITFTNGTAGTFENGSGTVIVNGNLTIRADLIYAAAIGSSQPFRNLASIAWIVLGDLIIDPGVKQLAGNFIILGNEVGHCQGFATTCSNDSECSAMGVPCVVSCDPTIEVAGCGQNYSCYDFSTGGRFSQTDLDAGVCDQRLNVSGLMMAKKFYFDRTFIDQFEVPIEGSEIIIYDGRLLANTPPGVADFAKALPIWRSETFSR